MTLDAESRRFLDRVNAQPRPLNVRALRLIERAAVPPGHPGRAALAGVEEVHIPGSSSALPARLYRPRDTTGGVVAFFHGGGFVLGDLDTHDALCCSLAAESGCLVMATAYRLAPEHRFPAQLLDAYAATSWLAEHAAALGGDPRRLAVAGDSAGGNLAANVALMARDRNGPAIRFQLLLYPVTHRRSRVASQDLFATGYFLTDDLVRWFGSQHRSDGEGSFPYDGPFDATDHRHLPPALIVTAGHDPLRDQGAEYAAKLRTAGVAAELRCYEATIHGFMQHPHLLPLARQATGFAGRRLRTALG